MNLQELRPLIEELVKSTLKEKVYPFGGRDTSMYSGMNNKFVTGTLHNSVRVTMQNVEDVNSISIDIGPYGMYVEEGRSRGLKGVPVSIIQQWLINRNIGIRTEKGRFVKGYKKTRESYKKAQEENKILPVAFAIQKSIKKFGIRSTNFSELAFYKISQDKRILDLLDGKAMQELLDLMSVVSEPIKK